MGNGLVLGFFDGVHAGHRAVIESAVQNSSNPILVTLKNFNKSKEFILSRKKSFEKAKNLGIKQIVELDFLQVAGMQAVDFLAFLKKEFSPILISTGFNYTFGKNKSGDRSFLEDNQAKFGYKYFCAPPLKIENEVVSSTLIKTLLEKGNIEKANEFLESNFILEGKVVHGAQLGRTIGFPTANIDYPRNIIKLPYGVYSVKWHDKVGVMNWGLKPTVNNVLTPVVETHILDFSGDLYGENLEIEVLRRIRDEKKFNSLDELKAQIKKDIEECLK